VHRRWRFMQRTSCTWSGWREPAVGNTGMLAGEKRISATTLAYSAKSGWRKPAVGNTGMLAGEKRISATTLAHAAKSGWREPAVVSEPRLQKRNRDSPVTTTGRSLQRNAVASALPNHGELTPAAPGCVFASRRTMFDSRRAASGSPNHGGLTPAALGFAFASRRTMFDSRCTMFGSPSHGGLTLDALANVRLCIADGALCNERRAPGAAGVSHPWETLACSPVRNAYLQQQSHMQPRAAGVSQPWLANRVCKSETATRRLRRPVGRLNETPLQVCYRPTAG
jgi:hypothetical protein